MLLKVLSRYLNELGNIKNCGGYLWLMHSLFNIFVHMMQ